jgi:hypothetical protein
MNYIHKLDKRDDGLTHCLVCGGGEGALPTSCPGRRLTPDELDRIYKGELDFDRGPMDFIPIWWKPAHVTK